MGRWRPPRERSSPYITPQGYAALEKQLKQLWQKRKVVNQALSAAAKEGDRSENAEYIYRKKEQAEIDRRIRYLQKRLPDLKIVDAVADKQRVFFGAEVRLRINDSEEKIENYRIVGADESGDKGKISVDSPLAKALLKKMVGDIFEFKLADHSSSIEIIAISYPKSQLLP